MCENKKTPLSWVGAKKRSNHEKTIEAVPLLDLLSSCQGNVHLKKSRVLWFTNLCKFWPIEIKYVNTWHAVLVDSITYMLRCGFRIYKGGGASEILPTSPSGVAMTKEIWASKLGVWEAPYRSPPDTEPSGFFANAHFSLLTAAAQLILVRA